MSKKRISLRVGDGEIPVVGPLEQWRHLVFVYESLAECAENNDDEAAWRESAEWIRGWIQRADVSEADEWDG